MDTSAKRVGWKTDEKGSSIQADESDKKKADRLATKLLALSSATTSETKQAQKQLEQSVKALIENDDNNK